MALVDMAPVRTSGQPARLPTSFLQPFFFLGKKKVDRFPLFKGISKKSACGQGAGRRGRRPLRIDRHFVRQQTVFRI